ncbi:N-acetylmuramoyl-L-alanine amidase family protein [Caldalkalibacillus mannanilyticus]|uniref:N-acetylmuramoyl-L-alanine amidase family protein n=1 Tax=Caldalkalibacillus mannanilyticus TaxID=1418 RepID=UPI0004693ED4|nr:N-acetylmuramoyl-L-alanine amidase family protein [Caldalkalibacillus mannanilyticus]
MKKWFLTGMLFIIVASVFNVGTMEANANTQSQIVQLMIEGKIEEPEVPAKISNGRTFVPLRFIAEKMGANVQYFQATSTIEIKQGSNTITMKLGSKQLQVNGRNQTMDVAPFTEQGRTLVPIRFVSEQLGLSVAWQANERLVTISKPITLTLNGQALQKPFQPVLMNDKIYVPIFEIAKRLNIEFTTTGDHISFTSKMGLHASGTTHDQSKKRLALGDIVTFDGVRMVSYELVDSLLGTTTEYNEANKEIKIVSELNELRNVSFENGKFTFDLSFLGTGSYNHFFLESPHRLVIDLPHTVLADNLKPTQGTETILPLQFDTVRQVRVAQSSVSPHTVRIVFDLSDKSKVSFDHVNQQLQAKVELKRTLIVIDAGHGGRDPGALGKLTTEAKIVLDISLKIIKLLEEDPDVDVLATRRDDTFPTLDDRVKMANDANADIFMSVHANSIKDRPTVGGTETYIHLNGDKTFGEIVHKHLIAATKFNDRGLKQANFKVLRETNMVSTLIEIGFISNPDEEKAMMDSAFQDRVAKAMYDALKEYLNRK